MILLQIILWVLAGLLGAFMIVHGLKDYPDWDLFNDEYIQYLMYVMGSILGPVILTLALIMFPVIWIIKTFKL